MLASVSSATLSGTVGYAVSVEVHVTNGLPCFTIVGLPDTAVREARDRVRAAVLSSGLSWPMRRVTVNLAPSAVRKGGAGLDLPIAVGLLVATGDLPPNCTEGLGFCGELGLNGSLRHVPGMIALADASTPDELVVPLCDVSEATLVEGHRRPRGCHSGSTGVHLAASGRVAGGRPRQQTGGRFTRSRSRGGPWSAGGPACPRSGSGRSPSSASDRATRFGQDHVGGTIAWATASSYQRRGDDGVAHPLERWHLLARHHAARATAVPCTSSPGHNHLARRRWERVAASG